MEEAARFPATFRELEIVLDAVETKPFENVASEEKFANPVTLRIFAKVEEAEETNPDKKLERLPKKELLETVSWEVEAVPVTAR